MQVSEIKAKLKEAKDVMKREGETLKDSHQQLPQLSWMLFLKCFDDFETTNSLRTKGYEEILPDELRWRNWATEKKVSGDLLVKRVDSLFEKFKELEPEERKKERNTFSSIFRRMPNRIRDGYRLREILNIINEISFSTKEEQQKFAEVYKDELFDMVSSSDDPYYYTPRAVAKFIATVMNPDFTKGERVYDPACGFGGFLIESLNIMEELEDTGESRKKLRYGTIHANEKDIDTFVCGILNMMVNGIWRPNYSIENSLLKHTRDFTDDDRYEIIITNPTHGGDEDKTVADNVPMEYKTTDTTLLFLYRTMISLAKNGREAMIVPNGLLFGTGVADKIKEKLIKEFNLHTIVKLAGTTFEPLASVDMNVLFFDKSGPTEEICYYQMKVPERVKGRGKEPKYSKTKPPEFEDFTEVMEWMKSKNEDPNAWCVNVKDIISKDESGNIKHIDLDQKNPSDVDETIDLSPHELIGQILDDERKTLGLLEEVEQLIQKEIPK